MKKMAILFFVLFFVFVTFQFSSKAHTDSLEDRSSGRFIKDVLRDIRQSQGIGENEPIDCSQVTDEKFEELGEAFMSIMHPDPKEHALMDRIMGGEDSENLSSMHKVMGARYLGCLSGGMFDETMPGMMGGWMMAPGRGWGRWGMMDFGYGSGMMHYGFGGIFMWIIFLVVIVFLVYFIIHVKRSGTPGNETPLEVLKKRYARGEIAKDEFQRIKKDLES